MNVKKKTVEEKAVAVKDPSCGIVMPIADMGDYSTGHWMEVKGIILEAIDSIPEIRFTASLVSESDAIGVIHTRIVTNLYTSDIVVCDVSGRNPNVMFELGMRLAFDKPVVIIKDDTTAFSFDSGPIEHIPYPRDLRYTGVQVFKGLLASRVQRTYEQAINEPNGPSFLKSFGTFLLPKLSPEDVEPYEIVMKAIGEIRGDISQLVLQNSPRLNSHRFTMADLVGMEKNPRTNDVERFIASVSSNMPTQVWERFSTDDRMEILAERWISLSGTNEISPTTLNAFRRSPLVTLSRAESARDFHGSK